MLDKEFHEAAVLEQRALAGQAMILQEMQATFDLSRTRVNLREVAFISFFIVSRAYVVTKGKAINMAAVNRALSGMLIKTIVRETPDADEKAVKEALPPAFEQWRQRFGEYLALADDRFDLHGGRYVPEPIMSAFLVHALPDADDGDIVQIGFLKYVGTQFLMESIELFTEVLGSDGE